MSASAATEQKTEHADRGLSLHTVREKPIQRKNLAELPARGFSIPGEHKPATGDRDRNPEGAIFALEKMGSTT